MNYQPLSQDQVAALVAVAMAYDNRSPGEANLLAWAEAATRARWTFDAAREAIHEHYATSTDFLMPGHVTALIKQARRQPVPFVALPPASPASGETRERVLAFVGERFAMPRDVSGERRPQQRSAERAAAVDAARAELDAIRDQRPEAPE